jgi:ATP-binding cassette subfamily F protein 3
MREALAEALQDYGGALVVVAHDRHLLRATTDALWLVADGRVAPFDGDLDDYRDWVLERSRKSADGDREGGQNGGDVAAPNDRRARKRAEAQARQKSYAQKKPLADKLAKVEREMADLDAERKSIEAWLSSPEAYDEANKEALKSRVARQGDLVWQLARLEAEWLEVTEALDKLVAEP